ncbi:MAG TPA: hypothetical protein PLE74_05275 [Candidatus Cloacimonadota bacterium]|nr:hypothetical protein [Candidatus Cloacimonadota bacterium]
MKPKPKVGVVVLCKKITPFKQTVLDSLAVDYKLAMLHPKKASDINIKDYKAILVVDELQAWTWFNGKLKKFSKALDPKHTVYFITSGDPDWKWKKEGVKAVTSASEPAKTGKVIKEIRENL